MVIVLYLTFRAQAMRTKAISQGFDWWLWLTGVGVTFVDAHVVGLELEGSNVATVAVAESTDGGSDVMHVGCGDVMNAAGCDWDTTATELG